MSRSQFKILLGFSIVCIAMGIISFLVGDRDIGTTWSVGSIIISAMIIKD